MAEKDSGTMVRSFKDNVDDGGLTDIGFMQFVSATIVTTGYTVLGVLPLGAFGLINATSIIPIAIGGILLTGGASLITKHQAMKDTKNHILKKLPSIVPISDIAEMEKKVEELMPTGIFHKLSPKTVSFGDRFVNVEKKDIEGYKDALKYSYNELSSTHQVVSELSLDENFRVALRQKVYHGPAQNWDSAYKKLHEMVIDENNLVLAESKKTLKGMKAKNENSMVSRFMKAFL